MFELRVTLNHVELQGGFNQKRSSCSGFNFRPNTWFVRRKQPQLAVQHGRHTVSRTTPAGDLLTLALCTFIPSETSSVLTRLHCALWLLACDRVPLSPSPCREKREKRSKSFQHISVSEETCFKTRLCGSLVFRGGAQSERRWRKVLVQPHRSDGATVAATCSTMCRFVLQYFSLRRRLFFGPHTSCRCPSSGAPLILCQNQTEADGTSECFSPVARHHCRPDKKP